MNFITSHSSSSPAHLFVTRSKNPRERFQCTFRKLIGKALMNHLTLAASRRERFFGDDSPYEQTLLHAWHAIQSREGKRQLRHCASTCLFATCLVCSQLMPLPFERDIYCSTRVTDEKSTSVTMEGAGEKGKEKQ